MSVLPEVESALRDAVRRDHRRSAQLRRRVMRLIPGTGGVFAAVAVAGALAIAFVAVTIVHHRTPAGSAASLREPPHGMIVDARGTVLAVNKRHARISITPAGLPSSIQTRREMYAWAARVLGMSLRARPCAVGDGRTLQLAPLACAVEQRLAHEPGVPLDFFRVMSQRGAAYLADHRETYPGVTIKVTTTPEYPTSAVSSRAILGGLRSPYGQVAHFRKYLQAGDTVHLALDPRLQDTATRSLRHAVGSTSTARGGSFVAMNPDNGDVYAIGSVRSVRLPHGLVTYNGGFEPAAQDVAPIGSTMTPITALAALQSASWSVGESYDDTGTYTQDGPADLRHNTGNAAYGVLNVTQAIMVSSEDFFYNLGRRLNSSHPQGGALQQWARALGFGSTSGGDIGREIAGTLPTPAWRARRNTLESQCEHGTGPFAGKPARSSCGIADGTNRPWSVGDNENLAVGQGDVAASPLQVAVAYAAIENDGHVIQPHLASQITAPSGAVVQTIGPADRWNLHLNSEDRAAILTGLRDAASAPGGTSADVFGNFPEPVYGKTGTAQLAGGTNHAWYAGFVPSWKSKRPIVVVVSVDGGGFGAATAAPVARQIFSQWFFGKPGPYRPGRSHTL